MNYNYSHYKILFLIFLVMLSVTIGCKKDFLNTRIDTNATDSTLNTNAGYLFYAANSFYTALQYGFSSLDGNIFAAATDEAQQTVITNNTLIFNNGVINQNSNPEGGLYKTFYDGIRAANYFLNYSINGDALLTKGLDTVTYAVNLATNRQNLKWYIAEAHIARAYYYAELIKRWGGVPIITETLQLTSPDSIHVSKSSYDSVVNYIVSEIDNNKANLVVNWKTSAFTANDGRFSLGSALALKARVLLYAASPLHNPTNDITKWQKAAAAARDIITNASLGYVLDANYATYFTGNLSLTSNETIFAIRKAAGNAPEVANYPIATPGGNSGVCPSQNLVSDYEYTGVVNPTNPYANRDPRLTASIVTNGSTWNSRVIDQSAGATDDMANNNASRTGYYLKKFLTDNLNLIKAGTAQHNWIAYRYGEVLLNYAEAMNEAYGPDFIPTGFTLSARQALKKVRDRASTSLPLVSTTDVNTFRTAIKHERRIELAFEDHRYWDLLRWKDAETILNQPITGITVAKNAGVFSYQTVNIASRKFVVPANYYYPFAYSEIVNSKGALIQNPGY